VDDITRGRAALRDSSTAYVGSGSNSGCLAKVNPSPLRPTKQTFLKLIDWSESCQKLTSDSLDTGLVDHFGPEPDVGSN
jgi:hypothetical protein